MKNPPPAYMWLMGEVLIEPINQRSMPNPQFSQRKEVKIGRVILIEGCLKIRDPKTLWRRPNWNSSFASFCLVVGIQSMILRHTHI